MRKLGLIGGMSWASTEFYYRFINKAVQKRTGGTCNAPLVIESLNFCDLARITTDEQWAHAADVLRAAAERLEAAGATAILICANSMHKLFDEVQGAVKIPVLHIVDAVGEKMKADGMHNAALIGTQNVMTGKWYRQRLVGHGVTLMPVEPEDAEKIDKIIYDELMQGKINRQAERDLKTYITNIDQADFDSVVLGCTELNMIVDTKANVLPIYDSAELHALAGVDWILTDAP